MPFVDFTNILTVLLAVILFGLIVFLGKELHKSGLPAIMLFVFLIILVCHAMELMLIPNIEAEVYHAIARSIAVDFGFIFLSFVSYLWIDEIQSKIEKKKSIDDSLSWFWAKV